jgi:hypothetical protein
MLQQRATLSNPIPKKFTVDEPEPSFQLGWGKSQSSQSTNDHPLLDEGGWLD